MVGTNVPSKGIVNYTKKFGRKRVTIGFHYNEVIWNTLEDAGPKGMTVRELVMRTGIPEATVRKNLKKYGKMQRLESEEQDVDKGLPIVIWRIKRRWLHVR
ncbi:MAG: hypothetical protein ACXAC2_00510 [Candidatus Kariarchaeaceae archaeon]|jgi:hypothetical protein